MNDNLKQLVAKYVAQMPLKSAQWQMGASDMLVAACQIEHPEWSELQCIGHVHQLREELLAAKAI